MMVVDELHGDAATDDLLRSAGNLQSFFDQLGLEVAAAGGDEAAEEELEWLSNKDAFPTVDTMEPGPAFVVPRTKVVRGRRRRRADEELERLSNKATFPEVEMAETQQAVTKVVRRRWRRAEEGLDGLLNKDAVPEVTRAVRRRRKREDEEFYWFPNKDKFLEVETEVDTAEPETAVTKMVLRRRRAGASIAPTAAESGQMRRRQEDDELESMPKSNKDVLLEVETAEAQPRVKKKVVRVRRRLRRRAKEEPDWLPNKHTFLKVETAEPDPGLTKMVLRRRRAGASIAPTAPKPIQRRCSQCGRRKTTHWRAGPEGPRTLCNACGRRYKSERLVPEYQPHSSATFRPAPELHSSMPRRIVEMCRSSATLVVPSALRTHHLSRSPPRTKEAFCKTSREPFRGDLQLQASSDHAGLEVAAGGGGEQELERPSNEDALPVLETMEPSAVEPRVKELVLQGGRAATPGHQWCQHCGSMKKPQWRVGATEEEGEERHRLPNKNVPALETTEPRPLVVVHSTRRAAASSHSQSQATAAELGQRRCSHCGTTETPQWREGPEGARTLCNACGMRYRSGCLVPEYRPLSSPTFSPELHSHRHRLVVKMRSAGPPLIPPHR